jgi:dUTP pyrophosphatase
VPNAPGTIDADFPDDWMVLVRASASGVTRIRHGDRVAQAVISQFQTVAWQEGTVQPVTDRAGGIGSTG